MVKLLVLLIRLYRLTISPFLGQICRFHPSCSRYAEDSLLTHGLFLGSWLALKRLGKCHPFHPGGPDPVPPKGFRIQSKTSKDSERSNLPQFSAQPHALEAVTLPGQT
jgi:hypothetical protein